MTTTRKNSAIEVEQYKKEWKKNGLLNVNKIAKELSNTQFVQNVGAKKFVTEFYSMLLDKKIDAYWRERLIIVSKRYGRNIKRVYFLG